MSYQLHITSAAEHDLIRAVDYIEFTLKNPDAADKLQIMQPSRSILYLTCRKNCIW